jgi:hypothetical protein
MLDDILGPLTSNAVSSNDSAASSRVHTWNVVGSTFESNVILNGWAVLKCRDLFVALINFPLQSPVSSQAISLCEPVLSSQK